MKKNKTVAYLLAATLLVGGTFVGTKAWFTDSATVSNTLDIQMGTFELEVDETTDNGDVAGWELVRENPQESKPISVNGDIKDDHRNIRPGDYFRREYTITNIGTLDQKITLTEIPQASEGFFDLDITQTGDLGDDMVLEAGKSATFALELKIDPNGLTNEYRGNGIDLDILNLKQATISAEQINAPKR